MSIIGEFWEGYVGKLKAEMALLMRVAKAARAIQQNEVRAALIQEVKARVLAGEQDVKEAALYIYSRGNALLDVQDAELNAALEAAKDVIR